MNTDKLIKARTQFLNDNRGLIGNNAPLIADAFGAASDAIMAMPLVDRLTDAERERFCAEYKDAIAEGKHAHPKHQIQSRTRLRQLERLFGADFFKEEER